MSVTGVPVTSCYWNAGAPATGLLGTWIPRTNSWSDWNGCRSGLLTRTDRRPLAAFVATVVATGACSSYDPLVEDRDPSALFQTDSLSYKLDAGDIGAIGVQFTNRTADTTYFVNCNGATGVILQKLVNGEWRDAYSPVNNACLSPPIAVPPGGTANLPIPVFSGYPGNNFYPKFSVDDIPGVYRAVWTAAVTSYQDGRGSFGNPLPLEHRISNRFALRLSPR